MPDYTITTPVVANEIPACLYRDHADYGGSETIGQPSEFPTVASQVRARCGYVVDQEDQQAELIDALRAIGDPDAIHLVDKLTRCRQSRARMRDWGGRPMDLRAVFGKDARYRCEHFACWNCRRKRSHGVAVKGASRFHDVDNNFASLITVADSTTGGLDEVRQRVTAVTRGWRDRRDATAEIAPDWRLVELIGHVELDFCWPLDIQNLAPDQRKLVSTLPALAHAADDGIWVVRAHLAVKHDGIDRDELSKVLGRQWPGDGRVHVEPFHADQLASENAGAALDYSMKHRQSIQVGLISERWPASVQAMYWAWIHHMGRGMQPLRISVGPKRSNSNMTPSHDDSINTEFKP